MTCGLLYSLEVENEDRSLCRKLSDVFEQIFNR